MRSEVWRNSALGALAVVVPALLGLAIVQAPEVTASGGGAAALVGIGVIVLGSLAYMAWLADPRYILAFAIVLSPVSGNWQQLHIPGIIAPDRLLVVLGIASIILRAPSARDRPALRLAPAHYAMGLAVVWALLSANFAGTLLQKAPLLKIVETFGILPFIVFLVAPVVYRTPRDRGILLSAFVGLGTYLGLTQIFTMLGPSALVFPRYILEPGYGLHFGRGRGPFVDAVANGFALFVCAVACTIAARLWRDTWARAFAAAVGLICLFGTLLTLQRSIWIGTIAGFVVWLAVDRSTRKFIIPGLFVAAATVGFTLSAVPSLSAKVQQRAADRGPVWDRDNIAHAAYRMVEDRPFVGFGWAQFEAKSRPYYELDPNYPLTAVGEAVHNYFLGYAVQLGMIGFGLWALALGLGVVGTITTRGPPDVELWRKGFIPIVALFLFVCNLVPPSVFPNLVLWLWAGAIWSSRYPATAELPTLRELKMPPHGAVAASAFPDYRT